MLLLRSSCRVSGVSDPYSSFPSVSSCPPCQKKCKYVATADGLLGVAATAADPSASDP